MSEPEESARPEDYRQDWRESVQVYTWIWKELMSEAGRSAAKRLSVFLCAKNLVSMLIPWFLGELVNALTTHRTDRVQNMFFGIMLVSLVSWFFQRFEGGQREIIFGENTGAIDLGTNRLFLGKSLGQHLRENELLSAAGMEKGRMRAQESMNLICTEMTEAVFLLGASYLALWFMSPLAGVVSTGVFAICIRWALYLNQEVAQTCAPLDVKFRRWYRHRAERWERVERVKTNGKEGEEAAVLEEAWDEILSEDRKFWLWFLSQCSFRNLVSMCALFLVLGWTTVDAWRTGEGYGKIFPLFVWMRAILDNIWRIGTIEHRLSWNVPSLQSLWTALTLKPDVIVRANAPHVDPLVGVTIELRNVHHVYHPSALKPAPTEKSRISRPVLRGVSFTIKEGDRVALLGPSGAGKSTIMRLIQRGFDPGVGKILVNGTDLRDLDLSSWLRCIGYIPQQASVLEGTIKFNLLYGLAPEECAKVKDAFLWELLVRLKIADRMTEGLETKLGRGGVELSGGEAQRVMVAAALAKSPRFFLIDEATSSLDSTTERAVQCVIEAALTGDVGALIIAHRLSTVRRICTKFVVLRPANEGEDDEPQVEAVADSFEELYRISPTFRKLADDQDIAIAA